MKLLTISIAGYNVEKFIRQTLDSLCCQGIDRLEVFVVDDGGTDQTLAIARDFATRFPGSIIPVHKPNGGWGSTVNYSIEHATGKYFKLLDGDDYFDTEALDSLLQELEHLEADAVCTPFVRFDDVSGNIIERIGVPATYEAGHEYDFSQLCIHAGLEMHALAFKTALLQTNGIRVAEKCFYTDNEFRTKGLAYTRTIVFAPHCLYHYRVGREGQSVDISGLRKHYADCIRVATILTDFQQSQPAQLSPSVVACVENAAIFAHNILLLLGLKDELKAFDRYLDNHAATAANKGMLARTLRLTGYRPFGLFVGLALMKYKVAPTVKRLLQPLRQHKTAS